MDTEKLRQLHALKEEGILSEEEFQLQKQKLMETESRGTSANLPLADADAHQYAMFMHLALLIGLLFPVIGLVVPVVLWLMRRQEPIINQHGKVILNWLISAMIFFVAGLILIPMLIGIPLLFALAVCHFVFAIVAGVKANSGELWTYPLSFKFIK